MIFYIIILIILIIIAIIIKYYSNFNIKNKISKVFLINLKKRPERLSFFSSNYNLNIPFEIFNAIDGSTLNLSKLIKENIIGEIGIKSINNKKRKFHYELTNLNAIGCFLSHYYLWKQIINNKEDNFIIFEDDTIFNKITLKEINYRLSIIPNDWDIYILSNPNICYSKIKIKNNLFKVKRFFLTNAYIINKKAIRKIFETNTIFPINQQIDSYLSELAQDFNLNIYVHDKFNFFNQSNKFNTDIQDNSKMLFYDRCPISYPFYNNKENLSH
jgi:GR25 family glycosyltransferase involved in LPS biosynthesis